MRLYKIKLLVFGGRYYTDQIRGFKCLDYMLQNYKPCEILIIQGGATGADRLGLDYAKSRGIDHEDLPADWNNIEVERCVVKYNRFGKPYNAIAGHNRNEDMGNMATHGVGFWDGKSTGTKHMKTYLNKLGKPVKIFNY